ncbi:hypothetical protein A2914_01185 [Candidatus Nomurabacteria bacterium RIFCSPLOWO2_01_FULL_41_21]|uniref:Type II secretion system protein GspG C-terminal domain-containing protein n=2 Tax=Candidatus Nomuraibacteriota TaxID=1752729 RepID=A0A1F6V1X5_9BACT|nr:MAG: hypothetical protein A2733_02275 [Candidatus Nomurabacteria bacterium RIFCSPHIGHO2_01_FULL_40_20]OGI87925.1 MAG: hypothetical protein A2914_01185 [Candidatus Nomurabacteria bacterium RIFCSPLOWO2_01_FULL_41_21]
MKKNNFKKGFTLIELLVVIAIIGILVAVILAALNNSKGKANDSKIVSQMKSMVSQAQLYNGPTGTAVTPSISTITPVVANTTASRHLFNADNAGDNSLFTLIDKLPDGTVYYYAWDGATVLTGGKWFVAAKGSTGAFCMDYRSFLKQVPGSAPTTIAEFTTSVTPPAPFTFATVAGGYKCD